MLSACAEALAEAQGSATACPEVLDWFNTCLPQSKSQFYFMKEFKSKHLIKQGSCMEFKPFSYALI